MKKYSDKLINEYIMGYEIEDVDKLEDSPSFMIQAIEKSGDIKLYNLCSDKVKKNYSFVKYLVSKFSSDLEFICNISDYYLENTEDEFSRIELLAVICDLCKNDKEKYMRYRMFAHSLYYFKRIQIEAAKKAASNENDVDDIGMGFLLIFEEYNHSKIVLDFFAKKIIDGIFDEFDIDLEYMLHNEFHDSEKLISMGLNNYMLSFIGYYDEMLANYLSTNINLMDNLRNRILRIVKNWDNYNKRMEHDKYYLMFDKVHEYLSDKDSLIDETTFLYLVGSQLDIADKILKYDSIYDCSLGEVLKEIDYKFVKEAMEHNFKERIYLRDIKNIMMETLSLKNDKERYENSKILRIDFRK